MYFPFSNVFRGKSRTAAVMQGGRRIASNTAKITDYPTQFLCGMLLFKSAKKAIVRIVRRVLDQTRKLQERTAELCCTKPSIVPYSIVSW